MDRKVESWKDFGLYTDVGCQRWMVDVEDVMNNKKDGDAYKADDFHHFDMMHYCGHDWIKPYLESLGRKDLRCLEMGCGIGGSTRALSQYCSEMFALDYVEGLSRINKKICDLCDVTNAHHMSGDACHIDPASVGGPGSLDMIFSIQVFLHIVDKPSLYKKVKELLKPGGFLWIEDFGIKNGAVCSEEEAEEMRIRGGWECMESEDQYRRFILDAGLVIDEFDDRSAQWSEYVWSRSDKLLSEKEDIIAKYGEAWWVDWCRWATEHSWRKYHEITCPHDEIAEKYPTLAKEFGVEDLVSTIKSPQRFAGFYILVRKPLE